MLIGLIGKSGCGKSTITTLFKEINPNIEVMELDKVGHEALKDKDIKRYLTKEFGDRILDGNGEIGRNKLAEIVFEHKELLYKLQEISWKYVGEKIDQMILDKEIVILDGVKLPETKYINMCDVIILVEASYEERLKRVMKRDNIAKEQFIQRESASIEYDKDSATYVIKNDFNLKNMRERVGEIYEQSIISR